MRLLGQLLRRVVVQVGQRDLEFDGKTEAAVFPGDLPANPRDALRPNAAPAGLQFVRFRPPLAELGTDGLPLPLPHIRLDRALEFLMGDKVR